MCVCVVEQPSKDEWMNLEINECCLPYHNLSSLKNKKEKYKKEDKRWIYIPLDDSNNNYNNDDKYRGKRKSGYR